MPSESQAEEDGMAIDQETAEIRAELREIKALLVTLVTKLAADPVELVRGIGEAVARSQGYDRPVAEIQGQPADLFTDPSTRLQYEPENESQEREELIERLSTPGGWSDMAIEPPPGEFDEGWDPPNAP